MGEVDVCGDGFKIVCRKFRKPAAKIKKETKIEVINELFPTGRIKEWPKRTEVAIPIISEMEVLHAAERMKNKRAPGPGGIPPEIAKIKSQWKCVPNTWQML